MRKVLETTSDEKELQDMMTVEEEQAEIARFAPSTNPGDLSDGGMVGGVQLIPQNVEGRVPKGREARLNPQGGRLSVRRAWMHDGTESLLPLAYEPSGKRHDGALHYLRKMRCKCCNTGGFFGRQCPNCVKSGCLNCRSSTDPSMIIRSFYLRKEDVPFPAKFYGSINCFLAMCPRREGRGFLTEQDMRIHARSRHRMEYQAYMDSQTLDQITEVGELRRKVDALLAAQAGPKKDNMAAARAQRAANVAARAAAKQ